jgi:hypothetical protein
LNLAGRIGTDGWRLRVMISIATLLIVSLKECNPSLPRLKGALEVLGKRMLDAFGVFLIFKVSMAASFGSSIEILRHLQKTYLVPVERLIGIFFREGTTYSAGNDRRVLNILEFGGFAAGEVW